MPPRVLLHHLRFAGDDDRLSFIADVRGRLCGMAAHVWWRLLVPHGDYPFRLCKIFDGRFSQEVREQEADTFLEDTPKK